MGTTSGLGRILTGSGADRIRRSNLTDFSGTLWEASTDWFFGYNEVFYGWNDPAQANIFLKWVFTADDAIVTQVNVLTARRQVEVEAISGDVDGLSNQRELLVVPETATWGVAHALCEIVGGPRFLTGGTLDEGMTVIKPQHGIGLRAQEDVKRRAVLFWHDIAFGLPQSINVGVWSGDLAGGNFTNRQNNLAMDLDEVYTPTSASVIKDDDAGLVFTATSPNNWSTPHQTKHSLGTSDWSAKIDMSPSDWSPTVFMNVFAKFLSTTNNRAYRARLAPTTFEVITSATGSSTVKTWAMDAAGFAVINALAANQRYCIVIDFDADNGAAGTNVTFHGAPTWNGPWQQLGATITVAGTSSIFAGTGASFELGAVNNGTVDRFLGRIHQFELRPTRWEADGNYVIPPIIDVRPQEQNNAVTSFTDRVANVFTNTANTSLENTQKGTGTATIGPHTLRVGDRIGTNFGEEHTVTDMQRVSNVVSGTLPVGHTLFTGSLIRVLFSSDSSFDGLFVVDVTGNTISWTDAGSNASGVTSFLFDNTYDTQTALITAITDTTVTFEYDRFTRASIPIVASSRVTREFPYFLEAAVEGTIAYCRAWGRHQDRPDWLDQSRALIVDLDKVDTNYTVTSRSRTGNVATLTIGAHQVMIGQRVTVTAVTDSTFNVTKVAVTAVTTTTISYPNTGADVGSTASAGNVLEIGTGTATNIRDNPTPVGSGRIAFIDSHVGTNDLSRVVYGPFFGDNDADSSVVLLVPSTLELQPVAPVVTAADYPIIEYADFEANVTSDSASWQCGMPTNIEVGNLLLMFVCTDGVVTTTWETGWVEILDQSSATNGLHIAYRIADGTESTTTAVTLSAAEQGVAMSMRIDNWAGTTAPEIAFTTGDSATPDAPALNPANWDVEDTLWIAVAAWDGTPTWSADPAGYNLGSVHLTSGGADGAGGAIVAHIGNVASENPPAFTISGSEQWVTATVAVRPTVSGVVGSGVLVGGGTLVATGTRDSTGVAALSGGGSLVAVGQHEVAGTAIIVGGGTLTASGVRDMTGTAVLVGDGSLTALGVRGAAGTAVLTGGGVLVASGVTSPMGSGALVGGGVLTATAQRAVTGGGLLSGGGTLVATGEHLVVGAGALVGGGTLTATGQKTVTASAALVGGGTVTATGEHIVSGAAVLTGGGTLTALGVRGTTGAGVLAGGGSLTAAGTRGAAGVGALVGGGQLVVVGVHGVNGVAVLTGGGSLMSTGFRSVTATVVLAGGGLLTSLGIATTEGEGTGLLVGGGTLIAQGQRGTSATVVLLGGGVLTASGEHGIEGIATLTGGGTLTVVGVRGSQGVAELSGGGSLTVIGTVSHNVTGVAVLMGGGLLLAASVGGVAVIIDVRYGARTRRSYGLGRAHVGESDLVIVANTYAGGGPLVVFCHGAGGGPYTYELPRPRRDLDLLARTGCVVVVAELGGVNTWGNDTAIARIDEVRTYAQTTWEADLTRTILVGESMGGMLALNYLWRNPTLVDAVALQAPVVAADALHDRDALFGGLIDAAYGGTAAWEAAVPTHDPSAPGNVATLRTLASRVRIWFSTDDTVVLPSDVQAFATATGIRAIPLGPVGHTTETLHDAVPAERQAEWLWSHIS